MFYVSSISGEQIPFDPGITPISVAIPSIPAVSELATTTEIPAGITPVEATFDAEIQSALAPETENIQVQDDAALFEGHALLTGQDLADLTVIKDPQTLARAGAIQAYQIQNLEFSAESSHPDMVPGIESVPETDSVGDDSGKSPHRERSVQNYRRKPHERTRAVVAADIMSSPVFTLVDEMRLEEVQNVFKERKFRHIPILSVASKLVGIISDRNFVGYVPPKESTKIKERMVTNILTAHPQSEIRAMAEVMITHHVGCLPIIDETGSLVGILTRGDILRAIVNHAPIELWT